MANSDQLSEFYLALLQRDPDQAGLQYWQSQLNSGQSLTAIAQDFLALPQVAPQFGPGLTATQFVADLYQSVLGRTPDSGGLAYWVGQLNGGVSRAQILVDFTSPMDGAAVMRQGAASNFYNLNLIDPASFGGDLAGGTGVLLYQFDTGYGGGISVDPGTPGGSYYLSSYFAVGGFANNGDVIHGNNMTVNGSGNKIILNPANSAFLDVAWGANNSIYGYMPGKTELWIVAQSGGLLSVLDGSATPIQASSLNSSNASTAQGYVINVGGIGDGSAASVTAAANKAVIGSVNANIVYMGTDSGGNTEFWALHGNGDVTLIATLIGVPASKVMATDLV